MRINPILIHRATVVTPGVQNGKDPYGRPVFSEPSTRQIKCRLDHLQQRISLDAEGRDVLWTYVLFAGPDENFNTNMQITNVIDKQGNVVANGTFSIQDIFPSYQFNRLHHYELNLSRGDGAIA